MDPFDYPRRWEADVVLSDGGTVHLRPIVPTDADALVAFHGRLSQRTRYLRYFGAYPRIPQRDLERFTTVDHHDRVAFVALLGDDIVAVARYERLGERPSAEVAFVVEDAHQHRGLGPILLEHLAAAGRESGIRTFVAEVLAENSAMLGVFRAAGYQVARAMEEGVFHLEFAIDPTEESVAVAWAREQAAEARSVHNLLHPRSVALIGASADREKIGYAVLGNLLRADFTGPVYPVNAERPSVRGVRAYPSVLDIPGPVDLAVVAVPAAGIDEVMDACLDKGVKALVVISSGFGETGPDGQGAERRLATEARAHGMRVVGPNALGVVNTDPSVRLNATLAPVLPGQGRTGFFCQSGALGTAILADAASRGLGLSTFVSAGNRADVSGNDLLQYWETDPATDVVLLYLESFGNPRKFARLARRLGRVKPIVAVRSGRNAVLPALAANSVPVDEASVAALFEQAGVIRVDSLAQLFDTALLLAHQPLPSGGRVAIVGNSSAIGVLAADAALSRDLELAGSPVDVGAAAGPDALADAVRDALRRPEVDALVVVFVPPLTTPGAAYARALRDAVAELDERKPIVSTFLATEGIPAELAVPGPGGAPGRGSIPSYPSPERAVFALARATRYARWRAAPQGELARPQNPDTDRARAIATAALSDAADGRGSDPVDRSPDDPAGGRAGGQGGDVATGPAGAPADGRGSDAADRSPDDSAGGRAGGLAGDVATGLAGVPVDGSADGSGGGAADDPASTDGGDPSDHSAGDAAGDSVDRPAGAVGASASGTTAGGSGSAGVSGPAEGSVGGSAAGSVGDHTGGSVGGVAAGRVGGWGSAGVSGPVDRSVGGPAGGSVEGGGQNQSGSDWGDGLVGGAGGGPGGGQVELDDERTVALLGCYGIDVVAFRAAHSADDAVAASVGLGFPVVVKAIGERFWRRPDLVGVRLDLSTEDSVRAAYAELTELSGVGSVYVQRMARRGTGCAIGVQDDPSFGTLISFGLSGVVSDLVGDRAYRALPLTDVDAARLVRAPRASPLLTGYRGSEPVDLDALTDLLVRVAALAEDVPAVRWLTLEPILASPDGVAVLRGRVRVGLSPSRPDTGPRRLRSLSFDDLRK
ncbi:bifunctional GNAT family N-acetyltransferase/acetate--CoA ligase family protein [Actinophytocola xinjiangensis]|uniref:bifunctional acetate--CoA ligase family protein/GNAT family N-acetyltransferase n=1 Tax=Actinophytocola xinjiangensis TaxID=485602 RepID=UPI000A002275|nr:bifunctional GNAT family N-acetyltransferase/acetate--CoA ligase family protein [Actinophytocola xinjiangensis]